MTRKRYVKLLMSCGCSRNEANSHAKTVQSFGISYDLAGKFILLSFGYWANLKGAIKIFEDTFLSLININASLEALLNVSNLDTGGSDNVSR